MHLALKSAARCRSGDVMKQCTDPLPATTTNNSVVQYEIVVYEVLQNCQGLIKIPPFGMIKSSLDHPANLLSFENRLFGTHEKPPF